MGDRPAIRCQTLRASTGAVYQGWESANSNESAAVPPP
jgi:hypothetical protein